MRLQDTPPSSVTVNGKRYRMRFDFRRVLDMMAVLEQDDLLPDARTYRALKCVMRRPRGDQGAILEAVKALLFPAARETEKHERITDFEQDADYIRAAFLQCYHINLYRDKLHWMEFSALLSALPEGPRYSEILGIRARPMPTATKYNAEERKWLAKAKAAYALKKTDQEIQKDLANGMRLMAESLLELAKKG